MLHSVSLKGNASFRRLYHRGTSMANRLLVVYCCRNHTQKNRVGLTVSAKLGHAVVRNRLRRRLREIYRLNEGRFRTGWDIVVVARSRAVTAEYAELEKAYLSLAGKLGLLEAQE